MNRVGCGTPRRPRSWRASWPATRGDALQLNDDEIDLLEEQYNLPPGYFEGIDLGIRRSAVLTYFLEG
jgi:hypothetical protein